MTTDSSGPTDGEFQTESNDNVAPRDHLRPVYSKAPLTQTVRVFLLEDDDANALIATEFLKGYGFNEVVRRRSLEEAKPDVQDIANGAYDLVVLEVMLPDGTCVGLLDQIKEAGCACPVGLYTSRAALEDQAFYDRHCCDFIFAKPLAPDDFVATLDALKALDV